MRWRVGAMVMLLALGCLWSCQGEPTEETIPAADADDGLPHRGPGEDALWTDGSAAPGLGSDDAVTLDEVSPDGACCSDMEVVSGDVESGTSEVEQETTIYVEWPNPASSANSDPWISTYHDQIEVMRPRVLVVNFANGLGWGGLDELLPNSAFTEEDIAAKAQQFLDQMRESSRHQPRLDPGAPAFLEPELAKVVDLQDDNGHANSDAFPRGQLIDTTPGYRTVGYYELFTDAFAPHWGYEEDGEALTLGEIVDRGYVHEVIIMANQVDPKEPNPPDQVTAHILEVAMVAQAYDENLQARPGEFVKNGTPFHRQKIDMALATQHDHNSMPWTGRSLRMYFMNASMGVGCLQHSLGHEFEFRYNESAIYSPGAPYHAETPHPYLQPLFRLFAGFDMDTRDGVPFTSLYAGGNEYSYTDCDEDGLCDTLVHPGGTITPYRPYCGNTHYPPGATEGYDYAPVASVRSGCEVFAQPTGPVPAGEALGAEPFSPALWSYISADPSFNGDCGGHFLMFWYQNMPGLGTTAMVGGAPMKNWWPFMYY